MDIIWDEILNTCLGTMLTKSAWCHHLHCGDKEEHVFKWSKFWNRQNILHLLQREDTNQHRFCYAVVALKMASWNRIVSGELPTCNGTVLNLDDTKNFVVCCYPSLTVWMVEISREDEDGEKQWVNVFSTKVEEGGIGPAEVFRISDGRSFSFEVPFKLAAVWQDVLFIVHSRDSAFTMWENTMYTFFLCHHNEDDDLD